MVQPLARNGQITYPIGTLDGDWLRGFHPPERTSQDHFRWAEPKAELRIDLPPGHYEMTLAMGDLHGLWRGSLDLAVNGSPIPCRNWRFRHGRLTVRLNRDDLPQSGTHWLGLRFEPLDTSQWEAPDQRALGAPLFEVSFKRKGKQADETLANTTIKQISPLGHPGILTPMDVWLSRLLAARFQIGRKYIPRLLATLAPSIGNTMLSAPERLALRLSDGNARVRAPLFIVGMHRSGTTHLHNLLAQDQQFATARTWQAINPAGCVLTGWMLALLMSAVLPHKRPMDSVRLSAFSPQEDEFALAAASGLSPYWAHSFPAQADDYERYNFPDELSERERKCWMRVYARVIRRLTFWSRKRYLSKNPCNTARISAIRELFPDAQFVRLVRNPYDVYRSYMHLVREGFVFCRLQDEEDVEACRDRFLDRFRKTEEAYQRQVASLPKGSHVEVRFEDLEQSPIEQVGRVYERLGIRWTAETQDRLHEYLAQLSDYGKNRHAKLTPAERQAVDQQLGPFLDRWGYRESRRAA